MRTFEIKGFWGFITFTIFGLLALTVAISLPVSVIWVIWNAIIGEIFHGPMIAFWQAGLLTAIFAIILKIMFQPQISFQVKRVKTSEELDKNIYKLKKPDSGKE